MVVINDYSKWLWPLHATDITSNAKYPDMKNNNLHLFQMHLKSQAKAVINQPSLTSSNAVLLCQKSPRTSATMNQVQQRLLLAGKY